MDLAKLETELNEITVGKSHDEVASLYVRVQGAKQKLAAMAKQCETALIEWIGQNGDIVLSAQQRLYVGTKKTTKCRFITKAVDLLLGIAAGDVERFTEFLSANAIKHGAAKAALSPDDYAEVFETVVESDLATGKPEKKLAVADARFM